MKYYTTIKHFYSVDFARSILIFKKPIEQDSIILVKDTWEKVKPISDQAGEMFYNRLFSEYPESN